MTEEKEGEEREEIIIKIRDLKDQSEIKTK
jgi:hypothetical protein